MPAETPTLTHPTAAPKVELSRGPNEKLLSEPTHRAFIAACIARMWMGIDHAERNKEAVKMLSETKKLSAEALKKNIVAEIDDIIKHIQRAPGPGEDELNNDLLCIATEFPSSSAMATDQHGVLLATTNSKNIERAYKVTFSFVTTPVTLYCAPTDKHYNLGRFKTQITLGRGTYAGILDLKCYALEPNKSKSYAQATHPHVTYDSICLGQASAPLNEAIRRGDLLGAVEVLNALLHSWHEDNPHSTLRNWDGKICGNCQSIGVPDIHECNRCLVTKNMPCKTEEDATAIRIARQSCNKCASAKQCYLCGSRPHQGCAAICTGCKTTYCQDCKESGHIRTTEFGNICYACARHCASCGKSYSKNDPAACHGKPGAYCATCNSKRLERLEEAEAKKRALEEAKKGGATGITPVAPKSAYEIAEEAIKEASKEGISPQPKTNTVSFRCICPRCGKKEDNVRWYISTDENPASIAYYCEDKCYEVENKHVYTTIVQWKDTSDEWSATQNELWDKIPDLVASTDPFINQPVPTINIGGNEDDENDEDNDDDDDMDDDDMDDGDMDDDDDESNEDDDDESAAPIEPAERCNTCNRTFVASMLLNSRCATCDMKEIE